VERKLRPRLVLTDNNSSTHTTMPKGTKSKRNHSKTKQSAPAPPSVLSTRAATRSNAVPVEKNSGPAPSSQPSSIALPQNIYWSSNYNSQALWHTFCRCSSAWLFPISLLLSIVESSTQIVPNAQPDPNIPPPLSSLAVTMAMRGPRRSAAQHTLFQGPA